MIGLGKLILLAFAVLCILAFLLYVRRLFWSKASERVTPEKDVLVLNQEDQIPPS